MYLANHANLSKKKNLIVMLTQLCIAVVYSQQIVVICCAELLNLYKNLNRQTPPAFLGEGGQF